MYNSYDNAYELAAHEKSVATHGDKICILVKQGKFNFDTFTINSYQTIEYLLNKGAEDAVEKVLIDKLQDLHDKERIKFEAVPVVAVDPTYLITPNITNVDEGGIVTFNVFTANFGSGTLYWTITGSATSSDFVTYSGSVNIENDFGTFSIQTTLDLTTEGTETFSVNLRTNSVTGTVVATSAPVTINDTSLSPDPVLPTYTAPVLKSSITIPPSSYFSSFHMVGEVLDGVILTAGYSGIAGTSTGSILEPWNANNVQDVRVGQFLSAQTIVTEIPTYTNGTVGGSPYDTLNAKPNTIVTAYTVTNNLSDVEVGNGTITFKTNATRDVGPTPVDSLGNTLPTLVSNSLADGTLIGETFTTSGTPLMSASIVGKFPIYEKEGGFEKYITDYALYATNSIVPITTYTAAGGSGNYVFKIATEEVSARGPVTFYDFYNNVDITADVITTSISKTIETGLTVPYTVYTIPSQYVIGSVVGIKFTS